MKGLSKLEIKVIADLEFREKYYFTRDDISPHFANKQQMRDTIYNLHRKGRIVPLNRNKYFLIPVKARKGKWTDDARVIADEMFSSSDYFIGGWYAANYWRLTDQIPFQIDIWTIKRQGKIRILNNRFVFHRTTKNRITHAVTKKIQGHSFKILRKKEVEEWLKTKE